MGLRTVPYLTSASHMLGAAAAAMVLVWCIHFRGGLALNSTNKSLIFNLHPVLMLIGFIIFGGEAILSYKALPGSKEVKKLIHLVLHAIALLLGAVGIYAVFKFHNEAGFVNLYSLHSWVGLGTICLYGVQWIFGFVTFFFPGGTLALRRNALPWHALSGLVVFALAVATGELGFLEKMTFLQSSGLAKYGTEAYLVNFTALVVILFGISVVVSAVTPANTEQPKVYSTTSGNA